MTDEQERALRAYDSAMDKVKRQASGGMGQVGPRRGAEALVSQTYQVCVRLGVAPQIKKKYR